MKVLLTGADGLLGSYIARALLSQNYVTRCMVLPNSKSNSLLGLNVERVEGNVLNRDDVARAINGCDVVIHAAASTSVWPIRSKQTAQINYQGTKNMVDCALESGVQKFVHISSAAVFRYGTKTQPGTEVSDWPSCRHELDYLESKCKAQQYVLNAVKHHGLKASIINPTYMFGAFDSGPGSGSLILAYGKGQLPLYSKGGKNFVFAGDVAQAAVNAIELGKVGECYIAGNINLTYEELFGIMGPVLHRKPPAVKMPTQAMIYLGYVLTTLGKLRLLKPKLNHQTARISCEEQFYNPEKAIRELHMPQTDLSIAIEQAYQWFQANDYL